MQRRTVAVVDRPYETSSFADVMTALTHYADETSGEPLMLGGWEVEDPAITPPLSLLRRLSARSIHVRRYAYARDLRRVHYEVTRLLGRSLHIAGSPLTAGNVSIQQNSTQALLLVLAALKERGSRRVVIAAPAYYAVETICRTLGLETTIVPAADFLTGALDIARLSEAARSPGAVVLVTNPAYSLGVEYCPDDLNTLAGALPRDSWLLLDETRLGLSWRYDAPWYDNDISPRTVVVRSPSKVFFIHGLKVSLLLGDSTLVREVERLGEALVGSFSGDIESVALAYLAAWRAWHNEAASGTVGQMGTWHHGVITHLQRHLATARATLLQAGFSFSPIDSGPHVLAAIPRRELPSLKGLTAARRHGILLMDSRFFLHEHTDWHGFRINLCCDQQRQDEAFACLRTLWDNSAR